MKIVQSDSRALPAERWLVVLLDGEAARLFRLQGEAVEELGDGVPPVAAVPPLSPTRTRDPAVRGLPRPAGTHVHRVADRVSHLARAEHADRILAGGAAECVVELQRVLRSRLGGDIETLALPVSATAAQVAAAALHALRAEPHSREQRVLGQLIDAVGRGYAALGPTGVADAVNDHSAFLVVLGPGARIAGALCPACDTVHVAPAPECCPACGERLVPDPDLLRSIARLVRDQGGDVERIDGPAAEALRGYEGIAALLRYSFPATSPAPRSEAAAV